MSQHDDDDAPAHPQKHGEGWVVTFADMMALLMSFFVLLLSFSEQDQAKFKEVGGSLENAFGVQRQIVAYEMPKGTSIVAREFSPGKPRPTAVNEVRQSTIRDAWQTLEYDEKPLEGKKTVDDKQGGHGKTNVVQPKNTMEISKELAKLLAREIKQGKIEIESSKQRIVIRILEQGSFASGDDSLHPSFMPVLERIGALLSLLPGKINVVGHTDNIPIANSRFHSNLELSSARALAVAHYLLKTGFNQDRMVVSGYGDTHPLVLNDTPENRSHNRRVEIVITQNDRPQDENVPVRDQVMAKPLPSKTKVVREILVNRPASKDKATQDSNVTKTPAPLPEGQQVEEAEKASWQPQLEKEDNLIEKSPSQQSIAR